MIYLFPDVSEPIKQGDIFYPLPNAPINLDSIPVINRTDNSVEIKRWEEIDNFPSNITIAVNQCWGIVASQDCDTSFSPTISLFVVKPILSAVRNPQEFENKNPKWWANKIKKIAREDNSKWFYLPPDIQLGFTERMVAILQDIIQVPRESLETRVSTLRKGRLNEIADEHFRESIAQFFRRYPFDEWYPLNKEEFQEYNNDNDGTVEPFPWQE